MTKSLSKAQKRAKKAAKLQAKADKGIQHPADKPAYMHKPPKAPKAPRPARPGHKSHLPRMNDFRSLSTLPPVSTPFHIIEQARTEFWQSLPGFQFTLPFLTHEETTKLCSSFGLLGDNPNNAHDALLVFLKEFFDWMKGHQYAYCVEPTSKEIFFAFGRAEYYNSLLVNLRDVRDRVTAHAIAAIDVPLLINLVEGFVTARRASIDDRTLDNLGDENKKTRKERRKIARAGAAGVAEEFEQAARALTARLENFSMSDGTNAGQKNEQDDGMNDRQDDDLEWEDVDAHKAAGGPSEEGKGKVSCWSDRLLRNLGFAVDHWLVCLRKQDNLGGGVEWERVFGPPSGSSSVQEHASGL